MQQPDFNIEDVDIQPAPQSCVLFTIYFRLFHSPELSSISFLLPNPVAFQIGQKLVNVASRADQD